MSERISFTLSNMQRAAESDGSRRRAGAVAAHEVDHGRSAAAVAAQHLDDLESQHLDHVEAQKLASAPPPKLKSRRCCCMTLVSVWMLFSTGFFVLTIANTHVLTSSLFAGDAAAERRLARDGTITDCVSFGIWDSHVAITPLQLQVAVSMALGVRADDDDVHVHADEDSFFTVKIDHATAEEVDYIGSPSFLAKLNVHLSPYSGQAVLSRPPKLHKDGKETPVKNV